MRHAFLPLDVERWTLDVGRFPNSDEKRPTLNVQRSTLKEGH